MGNHPHQERKMEGEYICMHCRTIGDRELYRKGKTVVEVILWLFFLLPGLIYSIWRRTGRYYACSNCGTPGMIPIGSPMGKHLLSEKQQVKTKLNDTTT